MYVKSLEVNLNCKFALEWGFLAKRIKKGNTSIPLFRIHKSLETHQLFKENNRTTETQRQLTSLRGYLIDKNILMDDF